MPLDFPASPITGATYTAPNGTIWVWDGAKWANGVYIGTAYAPVNAPTFTGDARAVTPAAGDADTSVATTAFVQAAIQSGSQYQNYADNSGFAVNQRTYVSGTALGVGAFGHDRWKAGAGGATYTFAQAAGPATTITITAGTLQQVVEGASLAGGNYMLSWTGTAQGRVGAGTYAASPVMIAGLAAGTNATIEFNAGTLGQVNLVAGTIAAPWVGLPRQGELARCQRFYQTGQMIFSSYGTAAGFVYTSVNLPVTMRAAPGMTFTQTTASNVTAITGSPYSATSINFQATTTATGITLFGCTYTASADI